MVKIKQPFHASNHAINSSYTNSMDALKNDEHGIYPGNESQLNRSAGGNASEKLWDNDELVMKALRVYGKMPRPQVFNEISRVCKLSNLRKSRYFHEKMMKNNPFKDKIMHLINEEGEQAYPYFKIFFEEYKTKKQRLSLMNSENISDPVMKLDTSSKLDNSVENSVENSNDYENSNSDQVFYNGGGEVKTNNDEYTENYTENYNENDDYSQADYTNNNTEFDSATNMDYNPSVSTVTDYYQDHSNDQDNLTPLVDSNVTYLENLELKLKILTKEKDHMVEYFDTFTSVIDNLKSEIDAQKSGQDNYVGTGYKLDSRNLNEQSLAHLKEELLKMAQHVEELKKGNKKFEKEQSTLRAELKVTKNFANVENTKLQNELDHCKAQVTLKNEQIAVLKKRLEESLRQNRTCNAKHLIIQSSANFSKSKLNELKENMERMFTHIEGLTS